MKTRNPLILGTVVLTLACAADTEEQATADTPAAQVAAPSADEASLDQLAADYASHFNQHHASVVAEMYSDSALALLAKGTMLEGKPAILADLEAGMAASPTLTLERGGAIVVGDRAVSRGSYSATATPPGGSAISTSGHYVSLLTRAGDTWKIDLVVTNFDAPPPEGAMAPPAPPGEPPAEEGTMKELGARFAQAFNAGDWASLAALYADDAVVAFGHGPLLEGRAAVQDRFTQTYTGTQQVVLHDVGTLELGDGWIVDGGWYELTATTANGNLAVNGTYLNVLRRQPDGSYLIHWGITNRSPAPQG